MRIDRTFRLALFGIGVLGIGIVLVIDRSSSITSPINQNSIPASAVTSVCGSVEPGESIYQIILKHGGNSIDVALMAKAIKSIYNPTAIKVGNQYEVHISSTGKVLQFVLMPNQFTRYIVVLNQGVYQASTEQLRVTTELMSASGTVQNSLYESLIKKNVKPELIINFADIFAWEVDFLVDTRNGDAYSLIWGQHTTENGFTYPGTIVYAKYGGSVAGQHQGIYFKSGSGESGYYDNNGRSLRRSFLKAPLTYRRISSYFSNRRFHPILRYYRPHHGIDYAAPRGTPVVSIGSGVVEYKGWKGQAGKTVIVRHNSVYTTQYGHLSGYARGIYAGKRVSQNEVVGFVGTTGLSTGPHLDFRFYKFGQPINFLKLNLPSEKILTGNDLDEFKECKKEMLKKASRMRFNLSLEEEHITQNIP